MKLLLGGEVYSKDNSRSVRRGKIMLGNEVFVFGKTVVLTGGGCFESTFDEEVVASTILFKTSSSFDVD